MLSSCLKTSFKCMQFTSVICSCLFIMNPVYAQDSLVLKLVNDAKIHCWTKLNTPTRLITVGVGIDSTEDYSIYNRDDIFSQDKKQPKEVSQNNFNSFNSLNDLWLKSDGTIGWAVGSMGVILYCEENRWYEHPQSQRITLNSLENLWFSPDGNEGWAVGSGGMILHYDKGQWQHHFQSMRITTNSLSGIWMKNDLSEGWIIGENGEILHYISGAWSSYTQNSRVTFENLSDLWMNDNGDNGWAIGLGGTILEYKNGKWRQYSEGHNISLNNLSGLWVNADGNWGWTVGANGTILTYKNEQWNKHLQSETITSQQLNSIWFDPDEKRGCAVGNEGVILEYVEGKWEHHPQSGRVASDRINSLWFDNKFTKGWAVGNNGCLLNLHTVVIGDASLQYMDFDDLRTLKGSYILNFKIPVYGAPVMELIDEDGTNYLTTEMYEVTSRNSSKFECKFNEKAALILKKLAGLSCKIKIIANHGPSSYSIKAVYESNKTIRFPGTDSGKNLPLVIKFLAFVGIIGVLCILSIFFSSIRKIIFNSFFINIVGNFYYLYLPGLFMVHLFLLIPLLRMALFRDYRKKLKDSPMLVQCRKQTYIQPQIALSEHSSSGLEESWEQILENILKEKPSNIWLLVGKSGLGKTALMEKWTEYALILDKTPFLISLGSVDIPGEEVSIFMNLYGAINLKPVVALDIIKQGGFLIILDGLNEASNKTSILEFLRQIYQNNHVIVTSQFDPIWDRIIHVKRIYLYPFGKEQLDQLFDAQHIDLLLKNKNLKEILQLPFTAKLLSEYIQQNQSLPQYRLDIFRELLKKFDDRKFLITNLEQRAWELFKINTIQFDASDKIPYEFCEEAVSEGILTKIGKKYRFRHEQISHFFVANYLFRQDTQSLEKWYEQTDQKMGRSYWMETLDFWAELYAENAAKDETFLESYYKFLKEITEFQRISYKESLFSQVYIS